MNITIDDSSPDPLTGAQIIYGRMSEIAPSPNGWAPGQTCPGCFAQPDRSKAFNNTWHDSTYNFGKDIPYATVSFTGTAVYVMGIIISSSPPTNLSLNNSRLFFQIDGENQTNYLSIASVGPEVVYEYNIPFLVKEDLPNGLHNITIMNGDGEPTMDSLCLLDRIIYTTEVENVTHVSVQTAAKQTQSVSSNGKSSIVSSTTSSSGIDSSIAIASSGSTTQAPSPSSNSDIQTRPPQSKAHHSAVIIGGVFGALASCAILVIGLGWLRIKRRRQLTRRRSIGSMKSGRNDASSSSISGGSDSEPPSYDTIFGSTYLHPR